MSKYFLYTIRQVGCQNKTEINTLYINQYILCNKNVTTHLESRAICCATLGSLKII